MLVFVCSPYGGKKKNLEAAREYCLREIDNGNTPFAPHLLYPSNAGRENRQMARDANGARAARAG